MNNVPHIPVMLENVLAVLMPEDGEVYVDGTFGAGGYSAAFLEHSGCTVIAIDRDRTALEKGAALKEKYGKRLILVHGRFGDALKLVREAGFHSVNGFVLDVGVSSMQLDQAERGFSFRHDAPLDMRMDQGSDNKTAADFVNTLPEEELANLIYRYGDERRSRHIAHRIIEERALEPILTTGRLAEIVRAVVPKSYKDKIDPATRTFQALRVYVNDELGELDRALKASEELLAEKGRLVVVAFHSLEDTQVKQFLRDRSGQQSHGSRYLPRMESQNPATFMLPSRKALFPSGEEAAINPRSRSARMRYAIRTAAPPWRTDSSVENVGGRG
ncbi:MAG: 16S rRNA (cytosine(1402)-N(4))-methyltransferase [Alphaproteobacteria bacterium CG_4_9_14_3_um_filter_47_13]|nr:MAG: 16S rRNA (cytosine(1402)-N(4))-methyltransferase [Alphaproteobacteria bacterium CG_4_9_14_3_um_filter_47_13]